VQNSRKCKIASFQEVLLLLEQQLEQASLFLQTKTTTRYQFHQHFTNTFFIQKNFAQFLCGFFSLFWRTKIGEKGAHKMLVIHS